MKIFRSDNGKNFHRGKKKTKRWKGLSRRNCISDEEENVIRKKLRGNIGNLIKLKGKWILNLFNRSTSIDYTLYRCYSSVNCWIIIIQTKETINIPISLLREKHPSRRIGIVGVKITWKLINKKRRVSHSHPTRERSILKSKINFYLSFPYQATSLTGTTTNKKRRLFFKKCKDKETMILSPLKNPSTRKIINVNFIDFSPDYRGSILSFFYIFTPR